MKNIVILGSTGSIGRSALEVTENLGDSYKVVGLSANSRWELLAQQAKKHQPARVALVDESKARLLRERLSSEPIELLSGPEGMLEIVRADDVDVVLSAVVGAAGLPVAVEAIRRGKTLALANKEALVMAGNIIVDLANEMGVRILPVDSEHSAIFQALHAGKNSEVRKVLITASGGPFYDLPAEKLPEVTAEEALNHPTWIMGRKITIDSATLMNKAFEVIEAKWLFGLDVSQIEVVIHPQSIVHAAVEFCDGLFLAQMGAPDMKAPIQYALTYPDRAICDIARLDLAKVGALTFVEPDFDKFPALRLGYEVAQNGGTMGAVMNAANEVAVEGFLNGDIRFTDISEAVERTMQRHNPIADPSLEEIVEADNWTRKEIAEWISSMG